MEQKYKYLPPNKGIKRWNPKHVKFGDDTHTREKYYAFIKHRSQAVYRGESYELTWEDWQHLWPDELWAQRGRRITDLCLTRYDYEGEWAMHNVLVCTRQDHFLIKTGKYNV